MSNLNVPACSASDPMGRADVLQGVVWDKIHEAQSAISRQTLGRLIFCCALCKIQNVKSVSLQLNLKTFFLQKNLSCFISVHSVLFSNFISETAQLTQ